MTDEELIEHLLAGPEVIYRYVDVDHAAAARICSLHEQLVSALRDAEALTAERDALKAGQIDAIRAALEAAAVAARGDGEGEWFNPVQAIRALDPAAIAAKLKGDSDEN